MVFSEYKESISSAVKAVRSPLCASVTQRSVTNYRTAVKEGWAPQPTNDVQKAIWDKVHAMPTEPLKIKSETKKQEK